jgi:hypothetical protein
MTTEVSSGKDMNNFFSRNSRRISNASDAVGGNSDSAFAIEDEREPDAFTVIYRVALTQDSSGKFIPANRPAKRVSEDRPDKGNPVFALQPMKTAGVATEVALNGHIKSRKRRKRRRGSRG